MPDRDSAGFSQICPSCGRRVPRSVAKCRCGAELAVAAETPPGDDSDATPSPSTSPLTLVVGALLCVALGAGGYWILAPAPAATAAEKAEEEEPEAIESDEPDAPAPASAERRAWDAAALAAPRETDAAATPIAPAANPGPADAAGFSLEEMVDGAMPAIVTVETSSGRGSAFFVQHDTLITNVHVVQNDAYVTLRRMDGTTTNARVQNKAPTFDIAVLKVANAAPTQRYLPLGSQNQLKPGQEVIVIGSALGTLQNSVSRGVVSGLRRSGGVTLVQTDAAANPGNSGGPMLDKNGRVVGVTTAGYREAQGVNFAVSVDHVKDILDGRQANLGTTQRGLSDIKPMRPGAADEQSESDRRQEQGTEDFTARIASAARVADQIDDLWRRFRQVCYKTPITGNYDREWFAIFVPHAVPGDAAAGCVDYYKGMQPEMQRFKGYMRTSVENARRANVLPGTVRDTLRSKRLQFDWDRY
jgi:S1-C subfamily serine protease